MRVLLSLTLAAWGLFELGLRVRERTQGRGDTARDRSTRVLIVVSFGAAIGLAFVTASNVHSLRTSHAWRLVGLIVIWLGLALRVWAIVTLGRAFRTTVEVEPGQAVVSSGPYAQVRHPSYAGVLLIGAGVGLAAGNWLSLAICVVLPLAALVRRIEVEEAEMQRVVGDAYRSYQARTKRLVPGVW